MCRQKPNEYPIIEIGVGSYKHPNPEFGRIKFPTFEIVGWAPKAAFSGEVAVLPETLPAEEAAAAQADQGDPQGWWREAARTLLVAYTK